MTTQGYEITGQKYAQEKDTNGVYEQVVQVSFTTNSTPSVSGTVSVPQSLLKDKVAYFEAVKTAVEQAVEAHEQVNTLGS